VGHDGANQSLKKPSPRAVPSLAGLRVLVVDDSPTCQIIARTLLERAGIEVGCAASGALALDTLGREPFDLVLMDIELPDMDGFETARRIRQHASPAELPIVAMTAHDIDRQGQACLACGLNGVLAKPIALEELLAVLRAWRWPPGTAGIRSCRVREFPLWFFKKQHV
jgi:CheY-like chemotaxis protein